MSNYTGTFVPSTDNNPWNKAFDLVRDESTVLDIGCSTGNFGEALKKYKNCVVDGVEPDEGDYRQAVTRLRKVANGFAEDALINTFKDQKYDHIIFLDVIEHLYNPVETLRLVKAHLNPGGSIIFSGPNMAHVSIRLMLLKGDFEYGETGLLDKTHLHFYTLSEIERVFAEAGYAINVLDHTEATYPPELISDQLKGLGIEKTPKLEKLLDSDDARVFQYVGGAVVARVESVPRKQFSPDAQGVISLWYQKYIKDRDLEIKNLKAQLKDQKKSIINYEETLANIQKSKIYKINRFIVSMRRRFQKIINGPKK